MLLVLINNLFHTENQCVSPHAIFGRQIKVGNGEVTDDRFLKILVEQKTSTCLTLWWFNYQLALAFLVKKEFQENFHY